MVRIFGNIDDAELAARLGSINTFDRRGNVVWMDDFEGPVLKWNTSTNGDNAAVALSTTWPKQGSQCCKLTAGEGAAGNAAILRYINLYSLGCVGLEVSFTVDAATTAVDIQFRYYDGDNSQNGYMRIIPGTQTIQYVNALGAWADILTDINLYDDGTTYNTLKLVINTRTIEFVRVLYNERSASMAGLGLRQGVGAIAPTLYAIITHASIAAAVKSIYVDNVILTQNEP